MIALKSKLSLWVVAGLVLISFAMVRCNDNSGGTDDKSVVKPADSVDTSGMDTATLRPVKTTN